MSYSRATFHFHGTLNDHLPAPLRGQSLEREFLVPGSVKDLIESFGVPHPEIDWIVVNSSPVSFAYIVRGGDRVAVYPRNYCLSIDSPLRTSIPQYRFVLDVHLGKLAAYLRMLGFDTAYRNCCSDPELVRISSREGRILLTRDRPLLRHNAVVYGYLLRATDTRRQLIEVVEYFGLMPLVQPFIRCMACNGLLEKVAKAEVAAALPERTAALHDEFTRCIDCRRVYWQGSHYRRMLQWVGQLRAAARPRPSP